nr:PREDICTED: RNA polymerase II elongation factor ELL3 [Rhinolophus sinicus]
MAGPQEFLNGKFRLSFNPSARASLLMLRLNDAALRALQECQRQQVPPVISFQGNRGYLRLRGPGWSCLFSFTVSQCGQEGPGGGLDLVCQRLGRSGPNRLHCLGPLRERLTIWGAMDSIPAPSSVQGHNLTEDARDPENWQNMGDYSEGDAISQPQMALEEVPDSPASSQGHSLPGSSREHMAQWQVRNHHRNREPGRALLSSAGQKHLGKKRPAPAPTIELKEKRHRTLPLAPSSLQGLPSQDLQEGEDWEEEDKHEDMGPKLEHRPSFQADTESPSPEEVPDYLLQYGAIHSTEQQRAYEQDFETDYAEYRILHARVAAASQRFMDLGAEIKRVQQGTPEHKVLEEKIVQEYKKFRKRNPGYREEKHRCEYLHQKLSHIKGLILEFEEKNRGS